MALNLSAAQKRYIRKHTKVHIPGPDETDDELNIIPFLDIVINIIMFLLMTLTTVAFYAQIEASLPKSSPGASGKRAQEDNPLNLTVAVTTKGVVVTGAGAKLRPGCAETVTGGDVITVPLKGGKYDWDGLHQCLIKVKDNFEDERRANILADPTVEYKDVIRAMSAARCKAGKPTDTSKMSDKELAEFRELDKENRCTRIKGEAELFPDLQLVAGVK